MADLHPFRAHFDSDEVAPFDTLAETASAARKLAEEAHPGHRIRKIKLVRENVDSTGVNNLATEPGEIT